MIVFKRYRLCLALMLALLGLGWGGRARADFTTITYGVTVDTSSLSGTTGLVDFQFNPSDTVVDELTATVSNFDPVAGLLAGTLSTSGDVSGTIAPGPLTLTYDPDNGFNDANQALTFGNTLSFDVVFSGNLTNPNPSAEFSLNLYDSDYNSLLALDQNGTSNLLIDVNSDGTQTITAVTETTVSPEDIGPITVPEPSSLLLVCTALVSIGGWRRWRKHGRKANALALN